MAGGLWLLEVAAKGLTDDRMEDTRPVTTEISSKKHGGADLHEYVRGVAWQAL